MYLVAEIAVDKPQSLAHCTIAPGRHKTAINHEENSTYLQRLHAGNSWTSVTYQQPATQSADITDDSPAGFAEEQFEEFADGADAGAMGMYSHLLLWDPLRNNASI